MGSSVSGLTSGSCSKNPEGKCHALYEGTQKPIYTCKYCGNKGATIASLTSGSCSKNSQSKNHIPAI